MSEIITGETENQAEAPRSCLKCGHAHSGEEIFDMWHESDGANETHTAVAVCSGCNTPYFHIVTETANKTKFSWRYGADELR